MKVYGAKITENISHLHFNRLCSFLSPERQVRIGKYVRREDSCRSLLAELMIRQIIRDKLSLPDEEIAFGVNDFEKPYLIRGKDFHFNISHSGCWVVCAVDRFPVGVDIEMIRPVEDEIARRFFSAAEYRDLMEKGVAAGRMHHFFTLWTLKESYLKAVGEGLSRPLESFTIRVGQCKNISLVTGNGSGDWFFKQYDIDENYKMAVCASHGLFPETVEVRDWEYYASYYLNS